MKPVRKSTGGINDSRRRWSSGQPSTSLPASSFSAPQPHRQQQQPKKYKHSASSSSPPTTIELRGVPIHFPFKPYKCQEDYMAMVLDALLRRENALLESPTGTGKTLCLLCACLAWQREQSRLLQSQADVTGATTTTIPNNKPAAKKFANVPTIIYASRTHSQLSQVVRELRNTRYRPRHAVLGSREQMCVNPKVKKKTSTSTTINHDCSALNKERKCTFRNRLDGFSAPSNESSNGSWFGTQPVMDMEDLVLMGQNHKVCPFYYTRNLVEDAELVLVPYNYLFDKEARSSTMADIPWNNAVVIFDEAHNLESFATESASFDLSSKDIGGCMNEVDKAITYIEADPDRFGGYIKRDNLLRLKAVFMNLEEYIMTKLPVNPSAYLGQKMMDIFDKGSNINFTTHGLVLDLIKKLMEVFMEIRGGASKGAPHLEHFMQCLKRVFGETTEARCYAKAESYRVHVSQPQASGGRGRNNDGSVGRTVSYWCFAPSEAMRELQELNVRSILVTSGTLSPLESYALELDLPFPNRLENPHIISPEQIHVRVIGKGVSQKVLNSSYERRQDAEYYIELGNTLAALSRVIPMGMLIFFPSYGVMETAIERWGGPASSRSSNQNKGVNNFFAKRQRKSNGNNSSRYSFPQQTLEYGSSGSTPWKRLLNNKAIIIEPRSSSDLPDAIEEFHKFLNLPKSKGVALFGVCRGKISEGIDFAHDMCRAVIITGLPFAPSFDPKVKMKREFLDHNRSKRNVKAATDAGYGGQRQSTNTSLSGHDWYQQQAHRAVNQAVGRVIRNKRDYGAVLLLDSRFEFPGNQNGLSKWVRPHVLPDEGYGKANQALVRFYKKARELEANLLLEAPPEEKPTRVARILEYENEGKENNVSDAMPDEEEHTKIAIINREARESNGDADEMMGSPSKSYIPPQRIVATLDVSTGTGSRMASEMLKKDLQSKGEMSSLSMSSTQSSQQAQSEIETKKSATVKSKPKLIHSGDSAPTPAKRFFHTVQATMSEDEVSTIKKAVVAMKKHTQQKYQQEFLAAVRKVIELILKYDTFLNRSKTNKPELLVLLLQLLPKHFVKAVKQLTADVVFIETDVYKELKAILSENQLQEVHAGVVSFMTQLWFAENLRDERDMATEASKFLTTTFEKYEIPPSALSKMAMIVPTEAQRVTNALLAAFGAFAEAQKSKPEQQSKRDAKPEPLNRDRKQPPSNLYARNPYAKSKPSSQQQQRSDTKKRALEQSEACEDPRTASSLSLKKLLKKSESEIYVGKPNTKTICDYDSKAPVDLNCTICDRHMTQPFISECGHMACYSCWDAWLKKTGSCAHCRKPVALKSLALAVFKD